MKQLCTCGGRKIFGEVFLPDGEGKVPLIIFSHELGQCHFTTEGYARVLNEAGFACIIFDFCGGTEPNLPNESDPNPDMSVISERDEIMAIVEAARGYDRIDPEKIILCGASQGGMASALAAAELGDAIIGVALMYPALCISEDMHNTFGSLDNVGERFDLWGGFMNLSKRYVSDVWDLDVYEKLAKIKKPVLLMHGDIDDLVNISYSLRAADVLENCEFHTIENAGHGFAEESFVTASGYIKDFALRLIR